MPRLQPIRTREDKLQAAVDLGVPLFFVILCFVCAAFDLDPNRVLDALVLTPLLLLFVFGAVLFALAFICSLLRSLGAH